MRRPILALPVAVLTLTVASSCGSGGEDIALPAATPLSPDGVRHMEHSFSPDGTRIAYWSPAPDSERLQLWVANADLTAPVKLPVTALADERAQWSPDGTLLAAGSGDFGLSEVVIVPSTGGAVRRVTEGTGFKLPLVWSRRGELLSYYGTAPGGTVHSFLYSVATGESRTLVPGETRPHLGTASPDGSRVAYFVIDGGRSTVWVADGNGRNPRQLTTEGFEALEQFQEWSPDGKELLYQSRRSGRADLWVVPVDGGQARQLTRDIRNDFGGAWSADGKWIAFLSDRGRQRDVWVVPAAGGTERRVTDTVADEVGPVQWRPGSATLTFGVRTQKGGVWTLDIADGKERRLTPDSPRVTYFRVSPDGRQVLYVVTKAGSDQELALVPIAGGEARVLVEGGGNVQNPEWSPDGKQIAFTSHRGGSEDVWIVDASGGSPRQLTNWPGSEEVPAWTHDGSAIYFLADKDTKLGDIWRVAPAGGDPTRVTTAGNLGRPETTPGAAGFFATTIGAQAGQLTLSRFRADGTSNVVWDKSNVLGTILSPAGDAVLAEVGQADGKLQSMLLKADGSGGRTILPPGQLAQWWSRDGKWVVYRLTAGGAQDLGLLNLADGTTRRLTTTPESEQGAELTPDARTVVFRRVETVQRITAVEVSRLLQP